MGNPKRIGGGKWKISFLKKTKKNLAVSIDTYPLRWYVLFINSREGLNIMKTEITMKTTVATEMGLTTNSKLRFARHGDHLLVRVDAENGVITVPTVGQKNSSRVRFRADADLVEALAEQGLVKGNYKVEPFDMKGWRVRARWARQYPAGGWVKLVPVTDSTQSALTV